MYTDADASEQQLKGLSKEGDLVHARYVHLATHGILGFDRGQGPALVLNQVGTTGNEDEYGRDDGFLTLPEVSALKLNADLVVLSACRTGQGRMHSGEGVSSISRVFFYAGCRGVVCSLWSVDDASFTSDLMKSMYPAQLQKGRRPQPRRHACGEAGEDQERRCAALYWAPVCSTWAGERERLPGEGAGRVNVMLGKQRLWTIVLFLACPAAAQEIPKTTDEGKKALSELLRIGLRDGGLEKETGNDQIVLADVDKLRKTVQVNMELLTPELRNTLVAGWFEAGPERQRAYVALLRACGEEKKDATALGFAAFFTGVDERQRDRLDAARGHFEEALRHFESARLPSWQALSMSNIGLVLGYQKKYAEGIEIYQRALVLQRKTYGGPHRDIAVSLGNIAAFHDRLGQYDKSRVYYLQALEVERKLAEGPDPDVASRLRDVGTACYKLGDYTGALDWFQQEFDLLLRLHETPHPDLASCLWHLGVSYDRLRDYAKALDAHRRALAMRQQLPPVHLTRKSLKVSTASDWPTCSWTSTPTPSTTTSRPSPNGVRLYRPPHRLLAESLDSLGVACDQALDYDGASAVTGGGPEHAAALYEGPHPLVATSLGAPRLAVRQHGPGRPRPGVP